MATLFYFLIFLLMIPSALMAREINSLVPIGCPTKCGDVKITYPFGIGNRCFLEGFEVICYRGIPYLSELNLQLLEIFPSQVRVDSRDFIAKSCPEAEGYVSGLASIQLPTNSPYTISVVSNKFVVVGCGAYGTVSASMVSVHCYIDCERTHNGSCEASLPKDGKNLNMTVDQMSTSVSKLHCSYGLVVENGVHISDNSGQPDFNTTADISMRLGWGHVNCSNAAGMYLCGNNSQCIESEDGHFCSCLPGYEGNAYLFGSQGCRDVDECNGESFPCTYGALCINEVPDYRCECPWLIYADRSLYSEKITRIQVVSGIILCIGFILLFSVLVYWARRKSKLVKLQAEYFRKNGGILLQKQLSSIHEGATYSRIYTAQELRKATDHYSINNILGSGGNGTVYKGTLDDGSIVAIKKSRLVDQICIDQFINEILILTQINHRNVVKLLGCCLEAQVPMLVYEFIPHGNLYQKIHEINDPSLCFSWQTRFRIAVETADALCFLHSSASVPIVHRDIKSSNILLDRNYTAKVADFGISRLVPIDKTKVSTMILGTFGYLDPEYFNTGKLAAKSDVYSFGVVLLELLTGRKSVWLDSSMGYCSLAIVFLSFVENGNLAEILDTDVAREGRMEELVAVANVAKRCLRAKGDDRPTMKEVLQELVSLSKNHVQIQQEQEEMNSDE